MIRFYKSRRILIPDVPPPARREFDQDLVIMGIGCFCAALLIAALVFVLIGS
jgi:hypothetical protein